MREVEPDGADPDQIQDREHRIGESVLNPSESVGRIMCYLDAGKLCKHHVSPEVVQVEHDADEDDQTEHKHVLRSPAHLRTAACHLIALLATCATVLCCQDEGIDDVTHGQECQAQSTSHCIPVASQKTANRVVRIQN